MALVAINRPIGPASERMAYGSREEWNSHLFHLLVASGAATVIAGSYMTWATFYAGLIARNGVSGHGKYFIGLALAAAVAAVLPSIAGVWSGLRWLALFAGAVIAGVAFRDLRNLDHLVGNPAAGFYLPGEGNGLFVVLIGAAILMAAPFARPVRASIGIDPLRTLVAVTAVGGVLALVPGLYGEYYLHFAAAGHVHNHTSPLQQAHVLAALGVLLLAAAAHAALFLAVRRRSWIPAN